MIKKHIWAVLVACLSAQPLYAADVTVDNAWVRLAPAVSDSTSAYVTVHNNGETAITLVGAESNVAARTELHDMSMEHGTMHMAKIERLTLAAHESLTLAPGGRHIMLMGLQHALHAGDTVELRLLQADGEAITIQAPVQDMRH